MATIMHDTSVVLFGEPMFIDCGKPVHGPDRFIPEEPSAQVMWALVQRELRPIRLREEAAKHAAD